MKITFELNGHYCLIFNPEDELEKLFMDQMTADAVKGKTLKFFKDSSVMVDGNAEYKLTVER
jgi:hypothetical protein